MNNTTKMDCSVVCEMFETINRKLEILSKPASNAVESKQVDLSTINVVTERLGTVIEEVRKSAKEGHQRRHTIDIASIKVFLSLVIMSLVIMGLSIALFEQRKSVNQYKDNYLKYRYIRMQGKANEGILYHLEQQFKDSDSIKIIRKQVEKYEDLVKEQAERIERVKRNSDGGS